jgi:4-hydroxy-tetrahydrodipicolinate reductase
MGQAVQEAALASGHEVVGVLGRVEFNLDWPEADVAIDFTAPESALTVFAACRQRKLPLVSGTTGWESDLAEVQQAVEESGHRMVWASNFSLGVYLFRKALVQVAEVMKPHSSYRASIHEIHHTGKRDAPSGTAKTLKLDLEAEGIPEVPITAERLAGVPGTHTVEWQGAIDSMGLSHHAQDRSGFALGAVRAAEWLMTQTEPASSLFGMDDVWG